MIPTVVRSFAGDAGTTSTFGGLGGAASSLPSQTAGLIGLLSGARQELPGSSLHSRALEGIDGYNGQTPAFVTVAPAVDADSTQVFTSR